ncbi:uncharacterized protein LOC129899887 [Solanum dulcamara]|uniref:uncharacterized protein LOC129899887 n=1 Tax=Solanum dulcamara TaxID=45834 RepID=UPI002484EBB2|nr:uncharacterized protein LOC129899887 [Solanum dulcamara]
MAEYEACLLGLRIAVDMNVKEGLVIGDSDLLVHRVQGEWAAKNAKILPYLHCIKELNNADNLNNDLIKEICEWFKIAHRNSTTYRPQMNGVAEDANKNIKKILRKIVDSHRQWHKKLPYAFLGYLTTIRTSTRENPHMLVYGSEVVISIKVEIPSLRIIQEIGFDDAEWICNKIEQLMFIDEKRMDVVCHGQLYQNRMDKAFNKKVKHRQFTPGQLVLKKIFLH